MLLSTLLLSANAHEVTILLAPFAARAGEAGHDLSASPAVAAWTRRLAAMPGLPPMDGYA